MVTVYVITTINPDGTQRFVDVKGNKAEAIRLVKEIKEDLKLLDITVGYQILEKHL